jgi:hypothetical protein
MLTTLDFRAVLVDGRDMTLSFRFWLGEFVSGMPAPLLSGAVSLGGISPGAESPEGGSGAGAKRPGAVPNRRRFALAKRGLQRPATGPYRTHPRGAAPASTCAKTRAKRNKRTFTIHQTCYDIRSPQFPPRAEGHNGQCLRCRSYATGRTAIAIASHGEKARFAGAFPSTPRAGRPIIEVHLEQARLPGTRHGLSLSQGDEFAPRIPPAFDHDGTWQVQ